MGEKEAIRRSLDVDLSHCVMLLIDKCVCVLGERVEVCFGDIKFKTPLLQILSRQQVYYSGAHRGNKDRCLGVTSVYIYF